MQRIGKLASGYNQEEYSLINSASNDHPDLRKLYLAFKDHNSKTSEIHSMKLLSYKFPISRIIPLTQ